MFLKTEAIMVNKEFNVLTLNEYKNAEYFAHLKHNKKLLTKEKMSFKLPWVTCFVENWYCLDCKCSLRFYSYVINEEMKKEYIDGQTIE